MQGISKKMETVKTLTGARPRSAVIGLCKYCPSECFQKQGEPNRLEDKLPFATQ